MVVDQKKLAESIRTASQQVDSLAKRVVDALTPEMAASRHIPFYLSEAISFGNTEMVQRDGSFLNDAEDVWIDALTYAVTVDTGSPTNDTVQYVAACQTLNSGVLTYMNVSGVTFRRYYDFDFVWGFKLSNGIKYLTAGQGIDGELLPRTVLGFSEHGKFLRFPRSLHVRAGESLVFTVKPTRRDIRLTTEPAVYSPDVVRTTVHMIAIGHRNGSMAWPTAR